MRFTTQSMFEIINILKEKLDNLDAKGVVEFEVLDPDAATSTYSGNKVLLNSEEFIYRGYKNWVDLAQILYVKMLTPKKSKDATITMRFEKLSSDSFHSADASKEEKYGVESIFSEIHKLEDASFIYHYTQALKNVNINNRKRVLNLGINSGDEFDAIKMMLGDFEDMELVGVDYCESAIKVAKEKFRGENVTLYQHDINELDTLELGKFDLIISIGTLQSSNLNFKPLFMSIIQNYLKPDGAVILGFPNCRWIDGENIYGARVKNYPYSEMGLLYQDAMFCKKYLQQKKFRVTLTGKDYIFLTATSFNKIGCF
ncbi:MAG: methyltransferase domain-containing protein [Campylobacterales bacterium]|nr:methyltransferase domain-containing protein [Campylobacterales bacterium]